MHEKYTSHDKTELMLVGAVIRQYWEMRKQKTGETQTDFALSVLGVSQPAFNQIMGGNMPPPISLFGKLVAELEIPSRVVKKVLGVCPNLAAQYRQEMMSVNRLVSCLYPDETQGFLDFLRSDGVFDSVPKLLDVENCRQRFRRGECSFEELYNATVEVLDL